MYQKYFNFFDVFSRDECIKSNIKHPSVELKECVNERLQTTEENKDGVLWHELYLRSYLHKSITFSAQMFFFSSAIFP